MTTDDDGGQADARWPQPLALSAPARGSQVRVLRRGVAGWLRGDHLDADVVEDLVLATSEALENCCDHAFGGDGPEGPGGTMTVTAERLAAPDREGLVITVADDGRWQPARSDPGHRGRGLAMMRTLVDDVTVETGPRGTRVALVHYAA